MERAGSGLCAGRETGRNAVPEGGSAAGLTATIGPWTRGEAGSGRSGTVFEFPICINNNATPTTTLANFALICLVPFITLVTCLFL